MTCNDCIHHPVCYKVDSVPSDYAEKCGDFISDFDVIRVDTVLEIIDKHTNGKEQQ